MNLIIKEAVMSGQNQVLYLGIDVGSTTVKIVVVDPSTKNILFSRYKRHNACQAETVLAILQEIFMQHPGAQFRAAVCGSGGKTIADLIHAPYIQEVVANSIAVRAFFPNVRVAIELGGQDAKIIFFYKDEASGQLAASDMRMNGTCAGGTGAFIDEVASLLRCPIEEFDALAAQGNSVHDISGRCGVFAKTDIQPLLNQGGVKADIALSTFHAIAKQTIGGLAQGLELQPPVIFEGGPFTFNPTLTRVFSEHLRLKDEEIIRAPNPEILIAHGAALSLDEVFSDYAEEFKTGAALDALKNYRATQTGDLTELKPKTYFASEQERRDFEAAHKMADPPHHALKQGDVLRAYLGIDAGSTTSKFVLLDESENVVDSFYANNKGDPLRVVRDALVALKQKYDAAGIKLEIIALGTTGYGELLFDKAFGADYHTVETVAHVAAAQKYVSDVSFILDIGGQDMKAINVQNGIVTNITLNEACSSGCGSFLENFASTLHIPVDEIAEAAFGAKNPAELGSRCTVFMNSTIITEQKNGKRADDIMAGLCRSIIENVFTKVVRIANFNDLGGNIVVQGGTFKNDAVLRALEQHIGAPVRRAPYPGEMGAIGAALLTKKYVAEYGFSSLHGSYGKTRFIGLDALSKFDFTQEANLKCNFCANSCNRTLVTFNTGVTWVTGNRCERGEIVGNTTDPSVREKIRQITQEIESVPDMIKFREENLFKEYPVKKILPEQNITIGLPRALDFWRNMPFWTTFFRTLGFNIKISRKSSSKLFESGLQYISSDTVCFPAKLVHGHIQDLVKSGVDRIFMPLINRIPSETTEPDSTYTCPVVKGYGLVIKYSDNPQQRNNIPLDTPVFHWYAKNDIYRQLCNWTQETFGIPKSKTKSAIIAAQAAQNLFAQTLEKEAERIIASVEKKGEFAIVLAGRPYQFDELINHNLSSYFTSLGIPVVTVDALPGITKVDLSKSKLQIMHNNQGRLISGAIITAKNPALEYVHIFSFGCGHDALCTDEASRILDLVSGKSPLILKLDESHVAGPLRIRVRSFVETVKQRRQIMASRGEISTIKSLDDPYNTKYQKEHQQTKTILVPNTSPTFTRILTAAFIKQGVKAEALPLCGKVSRATGKKYLHNDICFPAQVVIGEAISVLQSGKYDPDKVAIGMAKYNCDCRLTNYTYLLRKALDDADFKQVPIITTDLVDAKNIHPGFKLKSISFMRAVWCLIMAEMLEDLARKIRPYELVPGETNKVYEQSVASIADALQEKGMWAAYKVYKKSMDAIGKIQYAKLKEKPVVFVTGEYLVNYHPDCNFYIEQYLEENNMEVEFPKMYDVFRKYMVHTISDIKDFKVRHSLADAAIAFGSNAFFDIVISLMEKTACKHPLYKKTARLPAIAKRSDPIMHHSINSGESFLISAEIMARAAEGVKSFVILQPFGCLPNHICGRGVIKRVKEEYPHVQILPLDYDPDTSFANIENRLQMLIMNAKNAA
jgi:predicted CoA-substrate-specific enzyme activase